MARRPVAEPLGVLAAMFSLPSIQMDLFELAQQYRDYPITLRRQFHAHPELSGQEFETTWAIRRELERLGLDWQPCSELGTVVTIEGTGPGKTFLLRADTDALPVTELNTCDYASRNKGVMHACGHDCHIAMLLTAARLLNALRGSFTGAVKLVFQPAEESSQGALALIDAGVLDGVDGAFALHVWSEIDAGKVCVHEGPVMATSDRFVITVNGKGGHGAQPHLCVDATLVAASIITSLQTVVSRELSPAQAAVLTVGSITSGTRWNVISETARMEGTARCFDRDIRQQFPERIERIASQVAQAYRAQAHTEFCFQVAPTINHPIISRHAQQAARSVFGDDYDAHYGQTMAGEDFSCYMERVPGAMALLGVRNPRIDAVWPQHSGHYQIDESVLIKGAMLHVQTALNFLA